MATNIFNKAVFTIGVAGCLAYLSSCKDPVQPPIIPPKPAPSISLTAGLAPNGVDINLEANYKDLKEPRITVLKNGNQIVTKALSESDTAYSETLSYLTNQEITKGGYISMLSGTTLSGRDTSISASVGVPNYDPTISASGIKLNMDEGGETNNNLENMFKDQNEEDNPVPFTLTSTDGKVELIRNGYNLTIKAKPEQTGSYQVRIDAGSDAGGKASTTLNGLIDYFPNISGTQENNTTKQPVSSGTVIAYEVVGNDTLTLPTNVSDAQGNNFTDAQGNFNFKVQKGASKLSEIVLKATEGSPGNWQGWTRTIGLRSQNHSGVLMRAVPYGQYKDNSEAFEQSAYEMSINGILRRFDVENLQGIQILTQNPYGAQQYGIFTSEQINKGKDKILDEDDINGVIGEYRIKPEQVFVGNNSANYTLVKGPIGIDSNLVIPNEGWIIVVPRTDMLGQGATVTYPEESTNISRGVIYINPMNSQFGFESTFSHEFGHLFITPNHPKSRASIQSIMPVPVTISTTGPFDKDAGKIIYETTYMDYPQFGTPHVDYLKNILGKNPK